MARPWWPPDACPPRWLALFSPSRLRGRDTTRKDSDTNFSNSSPIRLVSLSIESRWIAFRCISGRRWWLLATIVPSESCERDQCKKLAFSKCYFNNCKPDSCRFPLFVWKIGKTNSEMDRKLSRPNLVISSGTSRGYSEAGEAVDWSVTRPPC